MKNKKWILILAILFAFVMGHTYAETNRISGRSSHSAIYDSTNKQMIIFGGYNQGVPLSDLWIFDIERKTWKEIETDEVPPARVGHSTVYDSANKQMLAFGGTGQAGYLSDTWVFDIEKKKWEEVKTDEVPPARTGHRAIYDFLNKQMIIFGGINGAVYLSDLWTYDMEKKKWKEIETDEVPPARASPSAIYDSVNKQMLIFGGIGQKGLLSDLWIYDIEKKTWKEVETDKTPLPRNGHSAIYDSVNKQMLIFGGCSWTELFSDLWAFDIEKKKWEKIKTYIAPPSRQGHSAIYDSLKKQMLIFGGLGQRETRSDLWAFDIEKQIWEKLKPKYEKD